jgi:ribonuclease HI
MTIKPRIVQLLPFIRIGGNMVFPPPFMASIQTDGSYKGGQGRAAMIMHSSCGTIVYNNTTALPFALDSTETEWASVCAGLEFALSKKEGAVGIENDNLGVVRALIYRDVTLRQEYARYYRHRIQKLSNTMLWSGIRWIPRRENEADLLLR